ncbi:MAG: DNA (cytosine-5-)-methyltransferase [Alphaproteobacteria bacterium]|nr:DNA (cytosine-5-)-methyltransferase [Alphaproteobacteria bacterium]
MSSNSNVNLSLDLKNNYQKYTNQIFNKLNISADSFPKISSKPLRIYDSIELFAGAGGLALGLDRAGINHILLNEFNKSACETLKQNMPNWNVLCDDVSNIDFIQYKDKIDILTGGFPCQAFSYAGKNLGFEDTRGTLFFEFARAIKEIQPKIVMGENVKGLLTHDNGKTIQIMNNVLNDLGYEMLEPKVLKAIFHKVPQKRERLILIAIKKEYFGKVQFKWPNPYTKIYTMKDALKAGDLFDADVPKSDGQKYPSRKKEIMQMVPAGGYWRDLPINIQKEYMKNSFYLGGGKTGMARRISWDEPCLTLTCSPAQKQTERCHPIETRPLTIREYARIQTFPDSWQFVGSITSQYKQIGNAVPVNLAYEIGKSLIDILNQIEKIKNN